MSRLYAASIYGPRTRDSKLVRFYIFDCPTDAKKIGRPLSNLNSNFNFNKKIRNKNKWIHHGEMLC